MCDHPQLLKYPKYVGLDSSIIGTFCYIVRHPEEPGPTMVIQKFKEDIYVQFGDWLGNIIEPHDTSHKLHEQILKILELHFINIVSTMRLIQLTQAQLYFSKKLLLVDIRISLNKFAGPGMLKDIFGKIVPTQEVLSMETIDSRVFAAITNNSGTYNGNLLLKPSRFREIELQDRTFVPLHVEVRR